jgi:hypothetical protein
LKEEQSEENTGLQRACRNETELLLLAVVVAVVVAVGERETSSVVGQLLCDCLEGLPVVSI